jgi:hypothetical protein
LDEGKLQLYLTVIDERRTSASAVLRVNKKKSRGSADCLRDSMSILNTPRGKNIVQGGLSLGIPARNVLVSESSIQLSTVLLNSEK